MRPIEPPKFAGPSRRALARACWLLPAIFAALAASPPEVVKVRVPSAKISTWFPPGSDLQVLPLDRFDELVKAVRERPPAPRAARILKAGHSARWEAGMLVGRSELTVEAPSGGRGDLVVLEPWSPSLDGRGAGSNLLRATVDGRLGLKVEPDGPSRVEPGWTLRARAGSDGRAFALALPDLDISSLVLDLPAGLVPEAVAGVRIGPGPGPAPDRAAWRFEAARGKIDLRLRDPSEDAHRSGAPRLWLEGTTKVDLNASPVNWRADWTLDESPGAPRNLTIELDPGLEAVDVAGPRVASFRVEAVGPGSRISIRLDGEGAGPSPLSIRAICQVPAEGTWAVPSARPLDATWTGGRTTVRLDATRVFQSYRERSGRRVPPRSADPVDLPGLIFEPNGEPGPVADLTFRKPAADATVEVRGHLRLGDDVPRVEVALTWTFERGRLHSYTADLPPGWTPDRVVSAVRQPIPWHADPLSNGGTRVHLGSALLDDDARSLTLILSASARQAGVAGPLDLPRVRPGSGARLIDEVWVATPDPGLALRPILGRGLAWIDPPDPPLDDAPTPWVADDLRGALAWRWLADDAEARIDRAPPRGDPRGEIKLDAAIAAGRLKLIWSLDVESPRGDLHSVPIHVADPPAGPIRWRSLEPGGPIVEARPMGDARRAALGFPTTGRAWELDVAGPSRGRIQLQARSEGPWSGRGRAPILTFPDRYRTRGLVRVVVEDSTRVKVDAGGLTPIEPSAPGGDPQPRPEDATSGESARMRRASTFGYRTAGGRLGIETIPGDVGPRGGLIREAFLASQVFPGAGMRHRLTLRIAPDVARALELKMPVGRSIDRIRRDGLPVVPIPAGDSIRVEIPAPGAGRPSCTLTIDYRTEDDPRLGRLEPARLLPECSMPCLSFAWEIVAPEPWSLADAVPGLEQTDPRPPPSIRSRLLGFDWSPWPPKDRAAATPGREAMIADLDKAAIDMAEGETNLGDWLLRLDAGRRPLVIDRLAVRSAGWGPGSRISTTSSGPGPLGPVASILQPMGLAAFPLEGMILITARAEVPDRPADRGAWTSRLKLVPATGADPADRFQSAPRWRGEATPGALSAGESAGRPTGPGGWHAWRLVAPGWPGRGASASLFDERADRAWGWLVASIVLATGLLTRNLPARTRAVGLASIAVVTSVGLAWTWPGPSTIFAGLFRGTLGVMAFWLGRSLRPPGLATPVGPREMSTTSRRSNFAAGLRDASFLVAIGLASTAWSAGPEADSPILALLPFDGPVDPAAKADRVVLLLEDYERLKRLARPDDRPAQTPVSLVTASHRVGRIGPGLASVESFYEIEVDGGPATWSLPVGISRELSATVDGRPTPLVISPDGLSAIVTMAGSGTHRVRFRRSVPLSTIGRGGERASVPINRAAFARVAVAKGEGAPRVEIPGASGAPEIRPEGIGGGLGPRDVLEVRWFPEDRPPAPESRNSVEATCLWDARPVGDLFRLRLTLGDPDGASSIRLALEPGLIVRRHSIPGVVGIRQEGTPERPEWVAHVDPPLPVDVPIEVDLWRPAIPGAIDRPWPRIEVPAAGKLSGLLGFRRPSDWSGRLEPPGGVEAASEASFARAWGPLPDDGLTLAGAVRFARSPAFRVATGPVPIRRSVRTKMQVDLGPGRMNVEIDAALTDRRGRSFDLELGLPNDFRIARIGAVGLLDWQKLARDRLRLQFDGSEAPDRHIRIEGDLPVPADSVMSETRTYQAKIPWPSWSDADSGPGTLVISGPTRFQVDPGEGVAALPPIGPADPDAVFRSFFRVDRPSGLSPVRWSSLPAKVAVSVKSELTIDPDRLNWATAVTCDVSGGPADSLNWNLPTEWANGATVEIEGLSHRLVSEPKGAKGEITHWTILPDSPIWGRARLILRASRPLRPGEQFNYPQVAPLSASGRGSVERYDLAILNVSGRPLEVAGSPGLQAIDASQFRPDDSPSPARSIDRAYHVTGERWALRVRVGREGDDHSAARDGKTARVALARLSASLGVDGETWGLARYDLEPRPGPFLAVRLPEAAEFTWASVDDLIGPALRDGPGRWLIPLGDRRPRRVTLSWHLPAAGGPTARPAPFAFPSTDQAGVPTLISAFAPESVEIITEAGGPEHLDRAGWEVENVEQLARRVVDALADLDRSSRRDREQVLEDLIEIELRERCLVRGALASAPSADTPPGRLQSALNAIADASQAAGLDDLIEEARARVGLARSVEEFADEVSVSTAELVRVRRIGRPHFFRITWGQAGRPVSIRWNAGPPTGKAGLAESWAIAGFGTLISLALGFLIARPFRPPGRLALGLGLMLVLPLMAWEPLGALSALGLLAWGRLTT